MYSPQPNSLGGVQVGNASMQAINTTTKTIAGGVAEIDINGNTQNNSEVFITTANEGNGGGICMDMYINNVQGQGEIYFGSTNGSAPTLKLDANGDGTGRKMGFFGATTIAQQAAIAAPSGGTTIDTQARAAIQSILNLIGAATGGFGLTA